MGVLRLAGGAVVGHEIVTVDRPADRRAD
jgi:hypothetical protein